MRILYKWVFLVSVFWAMSIGCLAQSYTSVVKGRIVDKLGKPVANAMVLLESHSDEEIDTFTYQAGTFTDSNGGFSVINISNRTERNRRLFVVGSVSPDAITLIDLPPTEKFCRTLPNLAVTTVSLKADRPIDLGNILVKVRLQVVEITIIDADGNALMKTSKDWRSIYYTLRDRKGDVYIARGISTLDFESSIDVSTGTIRMDLPEGDWKITFISDLGNLNSALAETELITAKPGIKNLKVEIIVPKRSGGEGIEGIVSDMRF